jgi:hypothetical protein
MSRLNLLGIYDLCGIVKYTTAFSIYAVLRLKYTTAHIEYEKTFTLLNFTINLHRFINNNTATAWTHIILPKIYISTQYSCRLFLAETMIQWYLHKDYIKKHFENKMFQQYTHKWLPRISLINRWNFVLSTILKIFIDNIHHLNKTNAYIWLNNIRPDKINELLCQPQTTFAIP